MWRRRVGAVVRAGELAVGTGCGNGTSEGRPPVSASASRAASTTTALGLSVTNVKIEIRDDLQRVFADAGVTGTFVLLDVTGRRLTMVDRGA